MVLAPFFGVGPQMYCSLTGIPKLWILSATAGLDLSSCMYHNYKLNLHPRCRGSLMMW